MNFCMSSKRIDSLICKSAQAFTLIELLVVIGLIAILSGIIGLSLGTGDRGIALQNAQGTISSALAGVRAQAAINLGNAGIFVNAQPDGDKFLRELRLAVYIDRGTGPYWEVRGDPIVLPQGIFVVPNNTAFPTSEVDFAGDWTDLYSTKYDDTVVTLEDKGGDAISGDDYHQLVSMTSRGTTSAGQLVISPGEFQAGGLVTFDKPDFVRGLKVSSYGIATAIQDAEGFRP